MAVGGTIGLKGGSSVPEGGCSFTFITCKNEGWLYQLRARTRNSHAPTSRGHQASGITWLITF